MLLTRLRGSSRRWVIFFQAEDGIRDLTVTGVQTCALPIAPGEADTSGVYFVPPPGHRPDDDDALLERVAAGLPSGLQLELDGRYAAMFSYKMKTYALLDERGRFSLKGSAFRSRGIEPFQRRIIEEVVRALLDGRPEEVRRDRKSVV